MPDDEAPGGEKHLHKATVKFSIAVSMSELSMLERIRSGKEKPIKADTTWNAQFSCFRLSKLQKFH